MAYVKLEFRDKDILSAYAEKFLNRRANYILIFLNISSKIVTNSKKAIMPECIYLKESENHIKSRDCSFLFFYKRSLKSL